MNALNVGKPLARGHTLLCIRKFTLERKPISAVNVGKPSGSIHSSFSIREFLMVRNLMNLKECGKAFIWHTAFLKHQRLRTRGKT